MSREQNKSSKQNTSKAAKNPRDLETELAPALLERARKHANHYTVVLQPHDRLGYFGHCLEMPTVFVDGRTPDECIAQMREALTVAVAIMLEAGDAPPVPASEKRRDMQINIRLTAEEKLLIEQAAKQRGFRGISDFMRSVALSHLRRSA